MIWTRQKPKAEGKYLYREAINPAINQQDKSCVYTGCALMHVHFYEDLQSGIRRHLCASPLLPYRWQSCPVFSVDELAGEWTEWEDQ